MKILTRSPDGGCVTVATTRHQPLEGSIVAESMVVFGSETLVRLSHGQTGFASGKSGFGGVSAAWAVPIRLRIRHSRLLIRCSASLLNAKGTVTNRNRTGT